MLLHGNISLMLRTLIEFNVLVKEIRLTCAIGALRPSKVDRSSYRGLSWFVLASDTPHTYSRFSLTSSAIYTAPKQGTRQYFSSSSDLLPVTPRRTITYFTITYRLGHSQVLDRPLQNKLHLPQFITVIGSGTISHLL